MQLRNLPLKLNLRGKRVLVRVDWNIPLDEKHVEAQRQKMIHSVPFLRSLAARGAIVIVLTHLGRPVKRDPALSTKRLASIASDSFEQPVFFHGESVSRLKEHAVLKRKLSEAVPGTIHVLENVRFEKGERENDVSLAKRYAELGEVFVNDAFASSHDAHASVVALAKALPSYAGDSLAREVKSLSRLIEKPKHPFIAFIGRVKLSTKIPLITALLKTCDAVILGSGHVLEFQAATSGGAPGPLVDPKLFPVVRRLAKHPRLVLPTRIVCVDDHVNDAHPETVASWEPMIKKAKVILWNGPIGDTRTPAFSKGTRALVELLTARRAKGSFLVAGGGDTIPEIFKAKAQKKFDHISMGGGAMLAFIAQKGKLPGLKPLIVKGKER